jgi:hypothetical protein
MLIAGIVILVLVAGGSYLYLANGEGGMYFVVDVVGERFIMLVVNPEAIKDALDNMNGLNNMHPIGVIAFGDGGFNAPWGWHYKPETVTMTDFSTEVCDAEPHFVQENLDYWVNTVQYYCPWSAKIISASRSIPSDATFPSQIVAQSLTDLPTLAVGITTSYTKFQQEISDDLVSAAFVVLVSS